MSGRGGRGGSIGSGSYSLSGDSNRDRGREQCEGRGRGQYEGRGRRQYEGRERGQYEGREREQYEGRGRGQYEGRGRRQYEGRERGQYEGREREQYEGRGRGQYEGRGRGQYEGRAQYEASGRDERSELHEGRGWQGNRRQFPRDEGSRVSTSSYSTPRHFEGLSLQDEGKFVKSDQSNPLKIDQLIKEGSKLLSRPGHGTAGRPIKLLSNYFKLNVRSNVIYHYDIEVTDLSRDKAPKKQRTAADAQDGGLTRVEHETERKIAKAVKKKVFSKWVASKAIREANPVYDGEKNVFTCEPLKIGGKANFIVELEEDGETREYEVTIQSAVKKDGSNEIHLKSLLKSCDNECEIIMALNSILNYREAGHPQVQIGRSFFYLNQANLLQLEGGLNIFFGHHQSVQSTEKGPAVLINLSAKAFHMSGPIIDYASQILGRNITEGQSFLRRWELDSLRDSLKGVRIQVTHLPYPRKYYIENVSDFSADKIIIPHDGGKKLSVAQYFAQKYGKLRFPFLNCLQMRTGNEVFIPFEHCVVLEGQPKIGKLNPFQTASMIKETAVPPNERFRSIGDSCRDVLIESGEKMSEYGLSLDDKFISVTGRVIPKPSLGFSKSGTATPDERGVWNISGNNFFYSSIDIKSWILIDFAKSSIQELQKCKDFFLSASRKVGLNFGSFLGIKKYGKDISAELALKNAVDENASFALIILSRKDFFHNYEEIKFIADYQMKFVSQCFDSKGLRRFNDQVATNLCLKINAKLGGINHVLHSKPVIMKDSTMIMGADVVHFARGSSCPSIAAVVGSVDDHAFKYDLSCRTQENPIKNKVSQELILDMHNMAKSLLQRYFKKQKKYPQNIIFFRDGVSEGQFQAVHDKEIRNIKKASQSVIGQIIPITFIVVTKRHQVRFKPVNPNEGVGKCRNVPPGTTVDTDIVHPIRFDYFVNSHEGIQGTSKSPRYTVLHDDCKFSPDELQQLSYYLCYTYNKCNRGISIPAPVKYADLACYREKMFADFHIEKERKRQGLEKSDPVVLPQHAKEAIDRMGESGNGFFFL